MEIIIMAALFLWTFFFMCVREESNMKLRKTDALLDTLNTWFVEVPFLSALVWFVGYVIGFNLGS